jgi:Big-like domain-containing protein/PKD domain-containing protein
MRDPRAFDAPLSSGWLAVIAPRLSALLVVGLPLLYAACGSDNLTLPGEGEPAHISIVTGDSQASRVGTQLAPLVVKVTDTKSRPVAGATVEFVFDDASAGGSVTPPSKTTDAAGLASAVITLGDQVGALNGHARVPVPQGTVPVEIAFIASAVSDDAFGIAPVSGNEQNGQVGSTLGEPLVVQVTDKFANPIPNVTVDWSVTGGGSVSEASTVTGQDGKTQVTRTLGTTAGPQTTLARAGGLAGSPVIFTHDATAGNPSHVEKVDGDDQSALAGTELPKALVVRVLDGEGNPVVGRAVTWAIGAGGGSVSAQNTNTDAQGKASTRWTLGPSVGSNTVNAVVSGVETVTFTATATAGSVSAVRSTVSASPRSITAGASNSTITVRVRDGSGTPVRGVSVTVTGSGSGNTVDPATDTSDDNGVATFAFGSTVAELKTITAVAGGVTLDQKPAITVVKAVSRTRITGENLATPTTAGTPVHVTFSVTSSEGGGTPTGQVTIFSEQEPSATCTVEVSAGACDLTLTVVGNHHLIATYSGDARFEDSSDDDNHQVVPAPNPPPSAAFTHDPCTAGSECAFHDASTDNGSVVGWSWDFGDVASTSNTSTLQNPTHSFTLGAATYHVTLTVTDNQGAKSSTSQDVVVP